MSPYGVRPLWYLYSTTIRVAKSKERRDYTKISLNLSFI